MLLERKTDMSNLAHELRKELAVFEEYGLDREMRDEIFRPIRKRLSGTPLRAYFVQKIFQIIQSKLTWNKKIQLTVLKQSTLFTVKVPFVFEVIITIQYLHNQILDSKNGVNSKDKISHNLLIANQLKDFLYEYVEDNFTGDFRKKLTKTVRKAFAYVDVGQLLEKRHNTFAAFEEAVMMTEYSFSKEVDDFISFEGMEVFLEALQKDLPREKWDFTILYLKRIYLTCAGLFKLSTTLLCDILGVEEGQKTALIKFSATYGMMRQLINDNADFVPASFGLSTVSKTTEDAFSDTKNRNITLPLIFHLSSMGNSKIETWLRSGELDLNVEKQESFSTELMASQAIFKSIQQCRLLSTIAVSYLETVPCSAGRMLADTCQIAWWNKFLAAFVKTPAYVAFKRTAYYAKMKRLMLTDEKDASEEVLLVHKKVYSTLGLFLEKVSH